MHAGVRRVEVLALSGAPHRDTGDATGAEVCIDFIIYIFPFKTEVIVHLMATYKTHGHS